MQVERDLDDHDVREPQRTLIEYGHVVADDARFFEGLDPVPARCRRQVDLFGELLIAQAAIACQHPQYLAIAVVELTIFHRDFREICYGRIDYLLMTKIEE